MAAPVAPAPIVAAGKPALVAKTPSWAEGWLESMRAEIAKAPASLGAYGNAAGNTGVALAEGAVVGGMLGALHAQSGLDTKRGPIDGWLAAGAAVASVALSGISPELAVHARAVASQSVAILAFRRSLELVGGEKLPSGSKALASGPSIKRIPAPGNILQDPIEAVAKALG